MRSVTPLDQVRIKKVLSDREIQLMRSAHLQQSARKSVKSKRVGGGGGDSGDSRKSEIGSMHSVATQGAAAECESKSASANNTHAAAAKTSVQSDHLVESKIKLCGVRRSSDGSSKVDP